MKPYTGIVLWGAAIQMVVYVTVLFWCKQMFVHALPLLWGKEALVAAIIGLAVASYYVGRNQYKVSLGVGLVCMMAAPSMFFVLPHVWNAAVSAALSWYALQTFVATANELRRKPMAAVAVVVISMAMQVLAIKTANDFLLRPLMDLTGEELLQAVFEVVALTISCSLLYLGWILVENHQRIKQARSAG